jgi:hypothetical protein
VKITVDDQVFEILEKTVGVYDCYLHGRLVHSVSKGQKHFVLFQRIHDEQATPPEVARMWVVLREYIPGR